jgi:sarcosine oxidase subunit alpha
MSAQESAGQGARLRQGGLIDRSKPVRFSFDGQRLQGYAGDTLASALLANKVRLVGRSFKYHRPRGIVSAGPEEPNALVELRSGARREPNTRATVAELYEGLDATSQNRWPSLRFDLHALHGLFSPLLPAGFYYKTFMWPAAFWEKLYEPLIRRSAGLGTMSGQPDPDHYEKSNAFCDLLVIGAGPAGLMAALTAARSGARVLLADEDFRLGGRCLAERVTIDERAANFWAAGVADELASMPNVRLMPRTTVFGCYDHGVYAAVERVNDHVPEPPPFEPRQRLWRVVAQQTILAAGAIERPLIFGDNDRPGIMLASAVRSYLHRYAVCPGQRAVVFADNDDGYRTATDLEAAGAHVLAIVDSRRDAPERASIAGSAEPVRGVVRRALGGHALRAVDILTHDGASRRIECDLLAVSGGWIPTLHLTSHHGARPRWDAARAMFLPDRLPAGMQVAGAANGEMTLASALRAGHREACIALQSLGRSAAQVTVPAAEDEPSGRDPLWSVAEARGKCFVDLQNDVTASDIELAHREGFRSVEQAKRYTTLGMATDQGKISSVAGLALLARHSAQPIELVGTTSYRPPYTPVALGALAGHHRGPAFRPVRLTPAHEWARAQGAVFVDAGPWLRAQYFPRRGETGWLQSVTREVEAVRSGAGICDVSTLGKIDLQGPDALEFLERLYANGLKTLAVGRSRYGLMLREDGIVMDDGTVSRLADAHYYITTTTANAVSVYQHMHYCHQVLWPALDVQFVSVTEQWAQFAIAGPRSRELLRRVVSSAHDIGNDAFGFLAAADICLTDGLRARLFRISFSGELAYELAVPAGSADAVVRQLFAAGADLGVTAYGLEALGAMRIEKGHVAGNELNGRTTAHQLGLGRMLATKKDYIGAVMSRRASLADDAAPQLVGVRPLDRTYRLESGAHLLPIGTAVNASHEQGYVSSVAFSPSLGHWIGLGFLTRGRNRHDERLRICDPLRGTEALVEVCNPIFVDPSGERLRV